MKLFSRALPISGPWSHWEKRGKDRIIGPTVLTVSERLLPRKIEEKRQKWARIDLTERKGKKAISARSCEKISNVSIAKVICSLFPPLREWYCIRMEVMGRKRERERARKLRFWAVDRMNCILQWHYSVSKEQEIFGGTIRIPKDTLNQTDFSYFQQDLIMAAREAIKYLSSGFISVWKGRQLWTSKEKVARSSCFPLRQYSVQRYITVSKIQKRCTMKHLYL